MLRRLAPPHVLLAAYCGGLCLAGAAPAGRGVLGGVLRPLAAWSSALGAVRRRSRDRVVAAGTARWSGRRLAVLFLAAGLARGRRAPGGARALGARRPTSGSTRRAHRRAHRPARHRRRPGHAGRRRQGRRRRAARRARPPAPQARGRAALRARFVRPARRGRRHRAGVGARRAAAGGPAGRLRLRPLPAPPRRARHCSRAASPTCA